MSPEMPCLWPFRRVHTAVAVVALLTPGCLQLGLGTGRNSGASSGGTGSGGTVSGDPCDAWKVSYCKAVSKCASFELRDDCESDIGYAICSETAPVQECTTSIDAALKANACDELPSDCGPKAIADRTEPTKACREIYTAICEWALYCSASESIDSCVAKLEVDNPCADYTAALYPNLDACVSAYGTLNCGEAPPLECDHILRK